jgi:hypothetical protein
LRHAHIITTKTTTTKMKTANDDCVGIWGNKKNGRGETHISKVSQPAAGPRIRAA